ncbi:protein of unknown function [Geosporobacter subterraneus DSM 17957]|uniref:DUF2935 domain-containing protein n=1 Tax=Geosporobacter subterraneus DSM 17957 TaxID=1121919 RepID=A0A1M6IEY7_9FIRM|nr:DUF2935 domain-containing protein [Geosporobacter subterraneus]SHJ33027.1 protein of unknown function [Geosporobacter subterraneus DSM 17957]
MLNLREEIIFWTEIMRDHAEFQFTTLSPREVEYIGQAQYYMQIFESLNLEAKGYTDKSSPADEANLIQKNMTVLLNFIQFKRSIVYRLMTCGIEIGLPPSFINHMINEAMEYYRVLCMAQGTIPMNIALENIRLHNIWLPDASGHASAVAAELDPVEAMLIEKAKYFVKTFDKLFKKAVELYQIFERTGLQDGSLGYFNEEVAKEIEAFISYLEKIKTTREQCVVLATGVFTALMPDHMMREEKYYLYRIQMLYK